MCDPLERNSFDTFFADEGFSGQQGPPAQTAEFVIVTSPDPELDVRQLEIRLPGHC